MPTDQSPRSPHTRKYSVVLLIASLVVIALGVALRPRQKPETPVSEYESARLQRLTQERRLTELGDYIAYASQNAGRGLLFIPELQQSAVVIGRRTLATAVRRGVPAAVTGVSMSNPRMQLQLRSPRPDVPVLLLEPPLDASLAPPPAAALFTGDWVLAVALREDATPVFAYGLYESSANGRCGSFTYQRLRASIPLTGAFLGGGLFSLRGELAGIIARCDSETVVLSIDSVRAALSQPVAPNDILQDRFGMRVGPSGGDGGVEVVSIWKKTPADEAGVETGDRIVEIDAAGVDSPEQALARLEAQGEHTLTVRRGRRRLEIRMAPKLPPEPRAVEALGLVLLDTPTGVTVRSVTPDGPSARAGVLPGDIVRGAGSLGSVSAATIAAHADRSAPLRLLLERNGAEFEVRVSP